MPQMLEIAGLCFLSFFLLLGLSVSAWLAQVRPELEAQVQDFKRKHFRQVTIGMQIRYS